MKTKMNKLMLLSAFSLNSLAKFPVNVNIKEISKEETLDIMDKRGFISYIGHQSTADILSSVTGREIVFNRQTLNFAEDTEFIVAQVGLGFRLAEGQVLKKEEIPENVIKFLYITIKY